MMPQLMKMKDFKSLVDKVNDNRQRAEKGYTLHIIIIISQFPTNFNLSLFVLLLVLQFFLGAHSHA